MSDTSGNGHPEGPSRRNIIRMAGLSGLGLGLAGCGGGFGGGGDSGDSGKVQLNMVWWGAADRAAKTQTALDIFQRKNPGITVKTEYQDSGPYKDKLAARFAAGDPPDLMAQRNDSLREYADRGALLDLSAHTDVVDVSSLSQQARDLATIGTKIYGIPAGLNAIGFVVNKTVTDKLGVEIPDGNTWTWDDLTAFGKKVTEVSKKQVYGAVFEAFNIGNIDIFARQRGEDFYTSEGTLGISEGTLAGWFEMVNKMRAEGALPPAGFVEKMGASPEQSYIVKGSVAAQIIPTNNFQSYNAAAGGNLVLLRMPGETAGKRRGMSIGCPHLWSIAAGSKHQAEALKLLNFLINDVEGYKALGTTRGVPANTKVAGEIKSSLVKDDQVATDYLIGLQSEQLPRSYVQPAGSSQVVAKLEAVTAEVEFKRQTPQQAAAAVVAEAAKALAKS